MTTHDEGGVIRDIESDCFDAPHTAVTRGLLRSTFGLLDPPDLDG